MIDVNKVDATIESVSERISKGIYPAEYEAEIIKALAELLSVRSNYQSFW